MTTYVRHEHLQELIRAGVASVVPANVCDDFARFLATLPWLGTGLDWSKLPPACSLSLSSKSAEAVDDWLRRTRAGRQPYLIAFFSEGQPGIAIATRKALRHLDEIFWKAPGRRFMFGAHRHEEQWQPAFQDFLEYDGGERLTSVERNEHER